MKNKPLTDSTILLGFYLGIGDFLSAVPVVNQLLRQGNRVVIAASSPNLQMAELLDFRAGKPEFISYSAFSICNVTRQLQFMSELRKLNPDYVFVSPHAVHAVSSWKIPLLLYYLRKTAWKSTIVVGADDEKLSGLFDRRVTIDRTLRLIKREWLLHTNFGSIKNDIEPDRRVFKTIADRDNMNHPRALVLHPGASRDIKMWPVAYFRELVQMFNNVMPVKFVGIPSELRPICESLRGIRGVEYICGEITQAVQTLSEAAIVVTMDSGFSHVAALLGVRHLALFGSTDPELYAPLSDNTEIIFENKLPCQPCNAHTCKLESVRCMELITPDIVGSRIRAVLKTTEMHKIGNES